MLRAPAMELNILNQSDFAFRLDDSYGKRDSP